MADTLSKKKARLYESARLARPKTDSCGEPGGVAQVNSAFLDAFRGSTGFLAQTRATEKHPRNKKTD